MSENLNPNIKLDDQPFHAHTKASERYVSAEFDYPENKIWKGWIPIEYRRTGVDIRNDDKSTLFDYLNKVYVSMDPKYLDEWNREQDCFWQQKNAPVTKSFFEALRDGKWKCVVHDLPKNSNFARRIQDLKEYGYTIATKTNENCPICKKKTTHLMMLHLKRADMKGNGYETFSDALRKRIISVLHGIDAYENTSNSSVLPDHKFSEIRWDNETKAENSDDMTDEEIKAKFQLLTNQRNQQKREICRKCFQTGERGHIFGIDYYYCGGSEWDKSIPRTGKKAEEGCIGCPWYDIQLWRAKLNDFLAEADQE